MAIPDIEAAQNGETKSLWDRFTEIITNIINTLRKDPDFVRDRGVEGGANLLTSAIKSVMEVAAFNGNINRNLAFMGYDSVSQWQTIKGANAAKAEAETLRKGKTEEFIEKNGLNLPPINREILSGVYNYEPEEASGTTSTATVGTYKKLYAFIENKAFGKSLQEFMADYSVVDWGSGMGRGTETLKKMRAESDPYGGWRAKQRIKLESYEPFFVEGKGRTAPSLKRKPRKETQDLVISSQVVNVIPADERAQLLQDIYISLKEEGQAIITTRTPADIVKQLSEKTMKVVGPAEYISSVEGKATTYQKGFSAKSLKKFIEEVLPEADVVTTGVGISPTYAVITKPKSAGIELNSDPDIQLTKIKSPSLGITGVPIEAGPETDRVLDTSAKDAAIRAQGKFDEMGVARLFLEEIPEFESNYNNLKAILSETREQIGEVSRGEMPIVQPQQVEEFGKFLSEKLERPVSMSKKTVRVATMKPYQTELFFPKTVWFAMQNHLNIQDSLDGLSNKPFSVMSSDGFILDGNHRYGQMMLIDPESTANANVVDLPIAELIPLAQEFSDMMGNNRKTDRGGQELYQLSKIKGEPKVSGAFFDDMYKSMPRGALSSLIRSGKISSPYLNSPSNVAVTDLDRSFHFTKKYAHLFSELLINFNPTYDEKNKDTFFKPTVKPVAHFVLQQLADLAVSLPEVQALDGVSRRMVDPFSIIKRHFKGGEKQPVEKVIRNLFNAVNSIDDIWTRTAANRDIVNLAELAEAVGSFNIDPSKDLPFKQGQSPFVREMRAAADAVRKERDDSLEQFTKIRGEESFPEMFSEKKKAEENVTEELSATFDVDVERIFALLGPKMYDSKLKDIVYKESLQNSYDAIKDLENQNPQVWMETNSQPQIEYGVWDQGNTIRYPSLERKPWKWGERILPASYAEELSPPPELLETIVNDLEKEKDIDDKQWVYIRDNGIGMSPEIIKSAYFTLGGSYKESDNPSGGFGLAKISMLRAAQEIFVKTVRDGVESTVRVDNKTLISKKPFQISSREVDAPSGTQVWMKFPKEVDGESVYLGTPSFHKKILDEKRQLLIIKEHSVSNTLSLKSLENYGYEKTSVRTLQADIDIFAYEIGDLDKDGKDISHLPEDKSPTGQSISNRTIEYYSNGLFQFSKSTPAVQNERVPYNIKVNIKPRVPADSMDYPFANTREKFSPQWSGKKSPDDDHPVEEEVNKVVRKYGREYFRQKFEEEFSIISGIDGNQPRPSVPIVYNNLDFDLDPSETELMNEFASIVNNIADQFLGVYKHDFYENDNSLDSNDDVGEALRNSEKADAENDPNFKGVSYHYGSALSKNWGGVNTGINPRVILVNPVYGSLNFTEDGELNKDVGVEGLAAFLTDIILHEVNHVGQRNEGAGFTYPFSAVRAYHSQMNPIFEESNRLIQDLIINKYESIKTLRKKFVKGSTKFLNAELQANKFVNTFAEPDNVRGREVRSRGEIVEQNFGKGVSPDEVQETNRGITILEAIVGRTFRANQVKDEPPVQDTQIRVQPTEDWTLYAGKQVGGLYISSDAIENGYSVLEKPANQEKKRKFEEAKVRLATYLEEERTQAELDGQVHVPFSYDVVSIEKDQVRFVLMSDLTEAHPHVVESLRVPNDPEKPVQEGRTGNAIYHRMEQILGFKHPLYQYHKTITDLEEGLGLLNLKDDDGKKVFPSGSERVWKQQVESTGYRYDSLKEEHRKIKQKFFGDPQDTIIGQEDITQTPEYIESSEAWDTLIDILRADIKVIEEDPDDVAGPIPNPVKFLQRKIYGKDAEMNWRKGGTFWSLFYGPYERTLRKYKNKSSFFKKAIQDVVLSYKSTTDRLLKEIYTDNGLDIPSRTIFEATGTTQFAPSEEVSQAIQDRYLDKVDEINKDSSLEGDAKKEALLEAYNEREAEKQLAARDVLVAARKRKSEALEKLRQDSPELAKHIISLRKLAGSISSEIGNMVSLASPQLQLKIDERQDIYLTTQYRMFTRPNWTEEFLELDIHRTARDLALDYFAGEYVRTQTEHLVREGGLDKETAEAQALDNLKNKPELKMMALENFLRSYDKDFGVDSLKRKANLPAALRGALGEFSEETNMDVLYRTLLNLGTLISKMSLKDKLVSQGIKSGWLVTQEKAALERERAKEAGRPNPYEDYVEVVKSKDSTISEELAGSLDDTGVQVKGEGFEVKLNPDGTVKETPRSKPPTSDPLIDYRVRTEDGSVERKGNLLARPDVKQAIIQVLNPKQGMSTPDNEYIEVALKLFGGIEKSVAGLTGLGMLSKTLGSIPFYERQILGSFLFLSQNGIPISGYIPALFGKDGEIGRSVLPSGVFKKRSYLEGRSADRGDMAYYASLKSMGVLDEGIVYSILKDLLSGNISKEDVELEIDHLKHPTKSILKKSKLFAEGSTSEKALRKAAELMKVAGKVKDIPIGKAQALALALDNAIKVQAYEYERSWLLDAREDSQTADRADEYRDLSNAELDEMAAQIVLRTQQSRSQSAPIVEFFNLPVLRIVTAPFARFLAENPRLLVNIMRQSSAEMNSSNPVIKERGSQRNKGFLFTNFVLYMALPMFLQRFVAGLGDDEERVLRKSAPEFSRFQNLFYLKDSEGEIGTVSLSYVHPMSPILDFAMRGFEHTMRGDIKEAIETVTVGYLFDTFLNDQIFWSAISDVKDNLDRDTGRKIVGEYSPDALKTKLTYILEKGLAPPTLIAASKSIKAIGTDYPTGEGTRTFLGYPLYSPQGQALRHLVPVKFYPLQLESMARRRFREIYDNMYFDLQNKNKLRRELAGFDSPDIDKIIRREFESLSSALKDARLAYKVYSDLIGSEGKVRNIMKESRFKKTLVGVVGRGYLRSNDLLIEGESLIDDLKKQGLGSRAYQLYQAYRKLINEQPMIPLD